MALIPARQVGYTTIAFVGEVIESMREQFVDIPEGYADPRGGRVSRVEHRGGQLVALDRMWPEAGCEALAWVNVLRRWTSTTFPQQSPPEQCGGFRVLHLQAGLARCATSIDDYGHLPSPEDEEAQALTLLDDADRLHLALCSAARRAAERGIIDAYSLNEWEPVGPEGGVVAGQQTITVQLTSVRLPNQEETP